MIPPVAPVGSRTSWQKGRWRKGRSRSGNIAVILALLLTVLLGFAALTIDIGYARVIQAQLQNTSEAAAHAGTLDLDGTEEGLTAARATAVRVAGQNRVAGEPFALAGNASNDAAGELVLGIWDEEARTFTASEDAASVNTVQVRAALASVGMFFSPVAFGRASIPVAAVTRVMAIDSGAGAVECFIPLALPDCLIDLDEVDALQDLTLKLTPTGVDNVGWGRPNGNVNAAWTRDQMNDCDQDGEAAVGDPVFLQNGAIGSAMQALATRISTSGTTWDVSRWGALPARMAGSSISAANYGKTYEGPVMIFDGGDEYCTGSGGAFNQSEPITGFLWGALYDVKASGNPKDLKLRLDVESDHNMGTSGGGPDYGVIAQAAPRMIPAE